MKDYTGLTEDTELQYLDLYLDTVDIDSVYFWLTIKYEKTRYYGKGVNRRNYKKLGEHVGSMEEQKIKFCNPCPSGGMINDHSAAVPRSRDFKDQQKRGECAASLSGSRVGREAKPQSEAEGHQVEGTRSPELDVLPSQPPSSTKQGGLMALHSLMPLLLMFFS